MHSDPQSASGGLTGQPTGLRPLLAVNFAGSLGYTIVMPFLVYLVLQWGGHAVVYGVISAAYSAFQLIGSPVLGRWSDSWGRKRILLLSQFGSLVSWLIALACFYVPMITLMDVDSSLLGKFTLTLPLLLLFLARALDGLTGGSISVANAYAADISPPAQLKINYGKLSASLNAGEVLGPALAGLLIGTALGYQLPVLVAAVVCFIAMMVIWYALPDSKLHIAARNGPEKPGAITVFSGRSGPACPSVPTSKSVSTILRLPRIPLLLSASFLVNLAFSIFNIALPVYVAHELGWSPVKMASFFVVMSIVMVVVEGPVLKRVSRVCSNSVLIAIGGLILALGFLMLDTRSDETVFMAALMIAIGNGLSWPLLVTLIAEHAGEQQGAVQGLAGSTDAMANVIGLLLGGILYSVLQGWLFFVSGFLIFIVALLALHAVRQARKSRI